MKRQQTLSQRLCLLIHTTPGERTSTYAAQLGGTTPDAIGSLLRQLRKDGMIVTTYEQVGNIRFARHHPADQLVSLLASGTRPYAGTSWAPEPDDYWTPQPWIHPIRARALGLSVGGR